MKKGLAFLLVILFAVLTGCSSGTADKDPWQYGMNTGLGGVNNNPDLQEFSYNLSLSQNSKQEFQNVKVELQINDKFQERILGKDGTLQVQVTALQPDDPITMEGKIRLDTRNMTKEEIMGMGPVIANISITWTQNGRTFTKNRPI